MSVIAQYDDVDDIIVATKPGTAIKYRYRSSTASQGGDTTSGQVPVAQRSSRKSAAATTNNARTAPKEPSSRADVQQQATRRRASQSAAQTSADTQIAPERLRPIQRKTQPGYETYDYTEYFDAQENPYTARTERLNAPQQQQSSLLSWFRLLCLRVLSYLGMTMLILLLGWWLLLAAWTAITTGVADHWNYGSARMTSLSAVVGHNHDSQATPTRFTAFETNGRIEIIEQPAGSNTKVNIYLSDPLAAQQTWRGDPREAVVDLEATDVNHDGKLDLVVQVYAPAFTWQFQRDKLTWTLINTSTGFVSAAGEAAR